MKLTKFTWLVEKSPDSVPPRVELCVSGADPLNLAGILVPGATVPALYSNRVLFRDGVAVAALVAGEGQYFVKLAPEEAWEAKNILLRGAAALQTSAERGS